MTNKTKPFSSFFIEKTRVNGEEFVTLSDDRPSSLKDLMKQLHDNCQILPSDWIYAKTRDLFISLETDNFTEDDLFQLADDTVDTYYKDLLDSLSLQKILDTADDAISEGGAKTIIEAIQAAQGVILYDMALQINEFLEANTEEE